MSLLRRNKDKQLAAEKKLAARHAIVKMGVDRNVRDAYFHGLVFAAVANDDRIEESERTRLQGLGEALELMEEDVAEAIQCLSDMDDDAKMAVIEECARQLMNVEVAECFLKEFEEIWLLGGGAKGELGEFKSQLVDWMGDKVKAANEVKAAAKKKDEKKRQSSNQQEILERALERIASHGMENVRVKSRISVADMKYATKCVAAIDADKVNWVDAVNVILEEIN